MVGLLLDNALKQVLIHCTVKLVLILIAIEKFNCKCFDWIGYWTHALAFYLQTTDC